MADGSNDARSMRVAHFTFLTVELSFHGLDTVGSLWLKSKDISIRKYWIGTRMGSPSELMVLAFTSTSMRE